MTALEWGDTDEQRYVYGIDRGVIHSPSLSLTLPWNGLTSVDESEDDVAIVSSALDGRPYANLGFGGFYQARVSAYGFPPEMMGILGRQEVIPGLILTGQSAEMFNFSYRTRYGDTEYKLHMVWNVLATQTKSDYATLSADAEPSEFQWDLTAVPPPSYYCRPTAHFIIDSADTEPEVLATLEALIYGDASNDPAFPTQTDAFLVFLT
jgi:hypothetical protein